MKWKVDKIVQETNHKFLNFFTIHYDVELDDGTHKKTEYYMVSRKTKDQLRPVSGDYKKPDAVLIALYSIDEVTNEVSVMITTQFRQPMGTYMTSIPAGLMDENDKDIFETARREALEEAGALIDDIEVLANASATSSGFSDEMNSLVLARVVGFDKQNLEEFEDIKSRLIPLKTVKEMMKDPQYFFPLHIRIIMMYLIERFKI